MNFLVETNRGQDVSPRTPASSKTLDIVDPELEAKLAYFASFIENYVVELMDVYPNQITKTQIRNLCFRPINLVNARENRKSPRRRP